MAYKHDRLDVMWGSRGACGMLFYNGAGNGDTLANIKADVDFFEPARTVDTAYPDAANEIRGHILRYRSPEGTPANNGVPILIIGHNGDMEMLQLTVSASNEVRMTTTASKILD